MSNAILNIVTSLAATFIYSIISKYFLTNDNKHEKEDNVVKIVNIVISLLIYISTLVFLFILSPIIEGRWDKITDVGMFNVTKISLAPYIFISISAVCIAVVAILVSTIRKYQAEINAERAADNKQKQSEIDKDR